MHEVILDAVYKHMILKNGVNAFKGRQNFGLGAGLRSQSVRPGRTVPDILYNLISQISSKSCLKLLKVNLCGMLIKWNASSLLDVALTYLFLRNAISFEACEFSSFSRGWPTDFRSNHRKLFWNELHNKSTPGAVTPLPKIQIFCECKWAISKYVVSVWKIIILSIFCGAMVSVLTCLPTSSSKLSKRCQLVEIFSEIHHAITRTKHFCFAISCRELTLLTPRCITIIGSSWD